MPRAEIPAAAVEAIARCQFEVVCPKEDWSRQSEWVRGEWLKDAERDLRAGFPALHQHWLEQLKEELLSDPVIDVIAEQNAIRELYGHWEDFPAKEANQRRRYAQLAKKPGVQESWKVGARRDVERFLAAISIPIEEGDDGS